MKLEFPRTLATAATLALALAGGSAQARDNVYWSIGIDAAPGVSLGVGNTRPVYVQPAPIYVAPQPVYVAPRPVVVMPQPLYYAQPAPVYYVQPGQGRHKHRKWHRKHRHGHWD